MTTKLEEGGGIGLSGRTTKKTFFAASLTVWWVEYAGVGARKEPMHEAALTHAAPTQHHYSSK